MFLLFLVILFYNRVRTTMTDVAAKPAAKKATKPKKAPAHPKYAEMVNAAITALKQRGGCSKAAILKYIIANYKVGDNQTMVNSHLKLALKAGVKAGNFKQTKGQGASGSFKLGEVKAAKPKKAKKPKAAKPKKKPAAKKPAAKKAKTPKKAAKKPAAKKAAAKPKKAKTPKKAAKKPAAKKPAAKKAAKPKKAKTPKKAAK